MTTYPSSPVDTETGSLLDLIADDWTPYADEDRNTFARIVREVAEANCGRVSQNDVRPKLRGLIFHKRTGPMYRRLCADGYLYWRDEPEFWEVSRDKEGRNAGKPQRVYRWANC